MVRRALQSVIRSRFLRQAGALATGSFLSQLVHLLFLPVLTRMFDAALFGVQALLQNGTIIMAPLASGQYELAVPVPRNLRRAKALATIAMLMVLGFSTVLLLGVALFRVEILRFFRIEALGYWGYAFPPLVIGVALMNISNYWLLRVGRLNLQTVNKTVMALSTAGMSFLAGLAHWRYGLVMGGTVGVVLGAACAVAMAYAYGLRLAWRENARYLRRVVVQYRYFPLLGAIPTAVTMVAAQIPLIIITTRYSLTVTGHYGVARNILTLGVTLLSVACGQVVLKHMAERLHQRQPLWSDYVRLLLGLCAGGAVLTIGVYAIGPWFFELYLGDQWSESAAVTRILAPVVFFWFVSPAMAQTLIALGAIRPIACWQVLYGVASCALVLASHLPFEILLRWIVGLEVGASALYLAIATATVHRLSR